MDDLRPEETELVGQWLAVGAQMERDPTAARIAWLVSERLEPLGTDTSGWDRLYRDPRDGRLWEHTYPQSEMHGGGPPRLAIVSAATAAAKYSGGAG